MSLANPEFVLEGDSLISTKVFDDYQVTMSLLLDAATLEKAIGSTTQEMDIASFNMGGTYTTMTLTDAAGTVLYERNESNSGFKATGGTLKDISIPDSDLVEKAYVMNGISTVEETKKLNKELVPEPTTTTLSLFALAGMLVRRRRH